MQITFGMFLDGSEWSPDAASLGTMVCGPLQMLPVQEGRLGLSGVQSSTPERISQYTEKIRAVDPAWCRQSFGLDSWTTAQQLLAWRDELVEAGWDAKQNAPSQRLQTLAMLEQNPLPLAPGVPDRLRTVLKTLHDAPCSDEIRLTEPLRLLPWVWREIFTALRRNGATLNEPEDAAPKATPAVFQVTGRDEATLATQLARYLAQGDNQDVALICAGDSGLLDGVLHRFGFGAIGEQASSRWRESLQILPLFLETAWKPFHPQRFLELLLLDDAPFPAYIRHPLADALQKEPGFGGEEWQKAWKTAAETICQNKHGYYPDTKAELDKLGQLRDLLEKQSFQAEQTVAASLLMDHCKFLQSRLGPRVTKTPALGTALLNIKALIGILDGKTAVSRVELARMLDTIIASGSDDEQRCLEVNDFHCVNHPAKLQADFDTVLWWNFLDDGRTNSTRWTTAEIKALPDFDPHAARQLEHRSWTNATRHARQRLIVFTPRMLAGETAFPHPFLNELPNPTVADAETLCDAGGEWRLADRGVSLKPDRSTIAPAPEPELAPSPIAPLRRLSYTQMGSLLTCPFQWFLQDYIGLRMPPAMNVPTGHQMYGNLAHKVVETLLTERKDWLPEAATRRAGELFDDLVVKMAAELLLDGQGTTRNRIRSTLCLAVGKLFEEIHAKGLTVVGTEHECQSTFEGLEFIGKIDILLQKPSGKRVVIDMKWSSANYLQEDLKADKALQLATYTWLLDPKSFNVDCKYFLFPTRRFLESGEPAWQGLWQRAVETWHIRLRQMAEGHLERGCADDKEVKKKGLAGPHAFYQERHLQFLPFQHAVRSERRSSMNPLTMIKASAGSGKTHRLMELLSQSIATGTPPEQLLATTYTVKAAAELQSRIRQKLLSQGKTDEAQRVFNGLIGTVNSVCGQLLSQYAIEAGWPPQLDVIPEENATPIFEAAISAVMDQYAESLNDIGNRLSLVPISRNSHSTPPDWKDDVRTIVNLARSNQLNKEQLLQCAEDSCKAIETIFTASQNLSLANIAARVKPCAEFSNAATTTQKTIDRVKAFLRSPAWHAAGSLAKDGFAKTKDPAFPIDLLESIQGELLSSQELYNDLCAMIRGVFNCAAESLEAYEQYKNAWGLIDFIDQESKVLHLLQNNSEFGDLLRDRLTQVLVDEFQDTSPIQLALFLKLNEFSEKGSVWVGDPKQAIYGFRGTDPELMQTAANAISNVELLPYSWRSKEDLVRLSNEIFTKAFSDMMAEEIRLAIPPKKATEAVGGRIEAWHLCANNNPEHWQALAAGIAGLIRDRGVLPSDIAVLMKTNANCAELAKALKAWNIQTLAPPGKLMATPECQLILAAFRYCVDPNDTVAMATILALGGEFPDWLQRLQQAKQDWRALPEDSRKETDFLENLRSVPILQKLRKCGDETPLEILERVITTLGLDLRLQKMPFPDSRMSNLEELRRLCRQYMEQARLERRAATPAGFAAMLLNDDKIQEAPGFGRNSVNVLTYHKAKGLEWPIVILESLDSDDKGSAFAISVKQAPTFDLLNPLQNRGIHYWPRFYDKTPFSSLETALQSHPLQEKAVARSREEDKRLLYVGLTRAKERLIFAIQRKKQTQKELAKNPSAPDRLGISWLERLSGDLNWDFPMQTGNGALEIGTEKFELMTRILAAPETPVPLASSPVFTDALPVAVKEHLPARLAPSQLPRQTGEAELMCTWMPQLEWSRCKQDEYDLLGNAFHAFFAINPKSCQQEVAERLLANWQQQYAVKPETVVTACYRLYDWIESEFPGSSVACEVPMTWRNEQGQLLQGFIDMLIDTGDGYVIVDHKTTIKPDPLAEAASHAAQLAIYRRAAEQATGRKVLKTIIHFPLMGKCVNVKTA